MDTSVASKAFRDLSSVQQAIVRRPDSPRVLCWASIASSPQARAVGLSQVQSLLPGEGMLFAFPSSERHAFTLAETSVNLDLIFLRSRSSGTSEFAVIDIWTVPAMWPHPIEPDGAVDFVLEVDAGWARRNGIYLGSTLLVERGERNA